MLGHGIAKHSSSILLGKQGKIPNNAEVTVPAACCSGARHQVRAALELNKVVPGLLQLFDSLTARDLLVFPT